MIMSPLIHEGHRCDTCHKSCDHAHEYTYAPFECKLSFISRLYFK